VTVVGTPGKVDRASALLALATLEQQSVLSRSESKRLKEALLGGKVTSEEVAELERFSVLVRERALEKSDFERVKKPLLER
jgi:hypothetical protein